MRNDPPPHAWRSILIGALVAAPLLDGGAACASPQQLEDGLPGSQAPAEIRIAADDEPGTPLEASGQLFAPDGITPAPGVVLYVYQTDATGRYAASGDVPRLRGWMRTDGEGRYRYRTIRPAAYPGREFAAHVHTQAWGGGYEPQWNRDLLFADDPLLPDRERDASREAGRFAWVCAPERGADGVSRCVHNLRLKAHGDRFEANTRHGLDVPPAGGR